MPSGRFRNFVSKGIRARDFEDGDLKSRIKIHIHLLKMPTWRRDERSNLVLARQRVETEAAIRGITSA